MTASGSSFRRVMDSVVGNTPGSGNAVGGLSLGPEPCGSGGPNWASTGTDDVETAKSITKSHRLWFTVDIPSCLGVGSILSEIRSKAMVGFGHFIGPT